MNAFQYQMAKFNSAKLPLFLHQPKKKNTEMVEFFNN